MAFRALKFVKGAKGVEPLRVQLDAARIRSLARSRSGPAAYVVLNNDLPAIGRLDDAVFDRGGKHKAKPLSKLLLSHEKIPLIRGSYDSPGQLARSIRALLENAARRGDHNIYIVGANEKVFGGLWGRTETSGAESPRKRGARKTQPAPITDGVLSSKLLLDLLPHGDVPEDLLRSFVGNSPETELVRQLILRAATHDEPVLILGDTGTGKEIIARSIHKYSARSTQNFVPVNCGAIPRDLLESELFGHKRFAFTDAKVEKKGLWEVTGNGTLFLDEIGDIALDHQVKILRALDEKKIRPIGESKEIKVNARVIAATNRDLFAMVQAGHFREDLYYRLRTFTIRAPALRNHAEDIPLLASHFWKRITADPMSDVPEETFDQLKGYRWPGNARELKAVLMSVYTLFGRDGLTVEHLRAVFQLQGGSPAAKPLPSTEKEIWLHRVECLRHLRKVDEVVRAIKVAMRPLAEEKKSDASTFEIVLTALRERLREIEVLCLRPLLFGSEITFSVVYRLKGKLSYFLSLLEKDAEAALGYWKDEAIEEFKLTLSAVFREVERLTASV